MSLNASGVLKESAAPMFRAIKSVENSTSNRVRLLYNNKCVDSCYSGGEEPTDIVRESRKL